MVWNWRFLRGMGIWCKCIEFFKGHKKRGVSLFINHSSSKYLYSYSEIYLGAKAHVFISDSLIDVDFSFSVRDGILVRIKSNSPYRVLFSYVDGAYYINDESCIEYNQLLESLSLIRKDIHTHHHLDVYGKLDQIMYNFISTWF